MLFSWGSWFVVVLSGVWIWWSQPHTASQRERPISGIRFFVDQHGETAVAPREIDTIPVTNYYKHGEVNCFHADTMESLRRRVMAEVAFLPGDLSSWFVAKALDDTFQGRNQKTVRRFASGSGDENKCWSFVGFWNTDVEAIETCIGVHWIEFIMPDVLVGERSVEKIETNYNEKCIGSILCQRSPETTTRLEYYPEYRRRVLSLQEHEALENYSMYLLVKTTNETLNRYYEELKRNQLWLE